MNHKTLIVESNPTARDKSGIGPKVDQAVAEFLSGCGGKLVSFAVAGDVGPNSHNRVAVAVVYEGGTQAPAAKAKPEAKAAPKAPAAKAK